MGGSVRDTVFGREPKDWDVATNARPEQVQALFSESFYNNSFGTVGVAWEVPGVSGGVDEKPTHVVVEVTTYRSEGAYSDFRRPDSVSWGKTIYDDLERRDFTINAIALQIKNLSVSCVEAPSDTISDRVHSSVVLSPMEFVLIDPYGGLLDLERKIVRTVGKASDRFHEDALRMLRAVRFASQLQFAIDQDALSAMKDHASLIQKISGERIRDELFKILASDHAYEGLRTLDEVGVLRYILPELVAGRGLNQRGHHIHDVFEHSLLALKYCPSSDVIVRLAALLHDIGKPLSHEVRSGTNTFYNHDIIGGRMVRDIAHRLHLSKHDRERLFTLVRYHMFSVDTIQTDSAVRRFIHKVGVENIRDMIDLRIGDRLGSGTRDAEGWRLKEFKTRIEALLMPTFTVKDLAINGNDVMRILGISPGPSIGRILNQLFEEVLDDPGKNTVEYLERRVVTLGKDS